MSEHKFTNLTSALIVSRAAHILKTIGWTKGAEVRYAHSDHTRPVSYCLMGALNRAACDLKLDYVIGIPRIVHEVINANTPNKDFVSFNDADSTELSDVLALLDKSCKQLLNPPKTPSTDDDEVGDEVGNEEEDLDDYTDDDSQIETDPDHSSELSHDVLEPA